MKKKTFFVVMAVTIALVLAFSGCGSPEIESFKDFLILADNYTSYGTGPDTAFTVTADKDYSPKDIEKAVKFAPETDFTVSRMAEGIYKIKPKNNLEADTVYTISLTGENMESKSVSFETYGDFKLLYMAKGEDYSNNINMIFSAPPKDLAQHIKTEPELPGKLYYKDTKITFVPDESNINTGADYNTEYTFTIDGDLTSAYGEKLGEDRSITFKLNDFSEKNMVWINMDRDGYYYVNNGFMQTYLPEETPNTEFSLSSRYWGEEEVKLLPFKETEVDTTVYKLDGVQDYVYYTRAMGQLKNEELASIINKENMTEVLKSRDTVNLYSDSYSKNEPVRVVLPQTLPIGHYLTEYKITAGKYNFTLYKAMQVTPVSYFSGEYDKTGETFLWLNNTNTGKALENANVTYFIDTYIPKNESENPKQEKTVIVSGKTDSDGFYKADITYDLLKEKLDIEDDEALNNFNGRIYFIAQKDGFAVADYKNNLPWERSLTFNDKYASALYLERELYRPTDTVSGYGFIKAREGFKTPKELYVALGGDYYNSGEYIEKVKVPVDSDGSYTFNIPYENLAYSSEYGGTGYYIMVTDEDFDEEHIPYSDRDTEYFTVNDFVTPDYTFTAKLNKDYFTYNDDEIVLDMKIEFFDGTPVKNKPVMITWSSYGASGGKGDYLYYEDYEDISGKGTPEERTFYTDENGHIEWKMNIKKLMQDSNITSWQPKTISIAVTNLEAEDNSYYTHKNFDIFLSDVVIDGKTVKEADDTITAEINVNRFEPYKIKNIESWNYEDLKGEALKDKEITVTVKKHTDKKEKTGEYMDSYENKLIPIYSYWTDTEEISSTKYKTDENGRVVLKGLPKNTSGVRYSIETVTEDSFGNYIIQYLDYNPYESGYYYPSGYEYALADGKNSGKAEFNENEKLNIKVKNNSEEIELKENSRFLNILADKNLKAEVTDSPDFTVDTAGHSEGFMLCGAYFDGKRIYPVNGKVFSLRESSVTLNMELEPEKENALPGETVNVFVTVKDVDGKPVKNTTVAVAAVDEALFALNEDYYDIFRDIYPIRDFYINVNPSYRPGMRLYNSYIDGGKGGGGDNPETAGRNDLYVRGDFKDGLGFTTAKTDADGKAVMSIKLADNLTKWRFTGLCVAENLHSAKVTSGIYSSLPFFVNPIVTNEYLTGDEVGINLRSFGKDIPEGEKVKYELTVEGTDINETVEGKINTGTIVNLGVLPEGSYEGTLKAYCGDLADAVKFKFKVIETRSEVHITKWVNITENEELPKATKTPVEIILYNDDYKELMAALDMITSADDKRLDTRLAKEMAGSVMKEYGYAAYLYDDEDFDGKIYDYTNVGPTGKGELSGMVMLPGTAPDLMLTARTAALCPEEMSEQLGTMISTSAESFAVRLEHMCAETDENGKIHYEFANGKSDDLAASALYIAATMGSNSFKESPATIESIAEYVLGRGDMSVRAKIYAIAALSYVDGDKAAELYEKNIEPLIKTENGLSFIEGAKNDNAVDNTAAALLYELVSGNKKYADEMVMFIRDKQGNVYTRGECMLELAGYAVNFKPADEENSPSAVVTFGDEKHTVQLDRNKTEIFSLTKEEYESLKFTDVKGKVLATVKYMGMPADNGFEASKNIIFTRSVSNKSPKTGDTVKVTYNVKFKENASEGLYRITDFVPSNMRLRAKEYSIWNRPQDTIYDSKGGRFEYVFYLSKDGPREYTVSYEMQCVADVKAGFDTTYIINTETMEGSLIERLPFRADTEKKSEDIKSAKPEESFLGRPFNNEYIVSVADGILKEIITPEMSPEEQIYAVYKYIIEENYFINAVGQNIWQVRGNPESIPTYEEQRALSPMLWGIGKCEDYASEMVVMLRRLGFDARYVFGMTVSVEGEYIDHAWLVVKLNDSWYHLDPQLEDDVMRGKLFMPGRYYLKSDGYMLADHRWGENLVSFRSDLTDEEKEFILKELTVPQCPRSYPKIEGEHINPAPRPNVEKIKAEIEGEMRAYKGQLPEVKLNFEPPMEIYDP